MIVTETDRLILRHIVPEDAVHLHALLTDADFLAHIGDRGVKTLDDARVAIVERYLPAYAHGIGMLAVIARNGGAWLGMAGLVDRDGLDSIDVGYAFLPAARGQGYALEAVRAVLAWGADRGHAPIVAIVNPDNAPSIRIVEAVGLHAGPVLRLPGGTRDVILYVPADFDARPAP